MKAELTFKHQIVFDLINKQEQYLTKLPEPDKLDVSFLGTLKPDHISIQIAVGDINPATLKRYNFEIETMQF